MNHEFSFHEWTPERHALFVDYRLRGMSVDWAMFWALIDRTTSKHVYSREDVDRRFANDPFYAELWAKPLDNTAHGSRHRLPQELIDQLQQEQT